MVGRTGIYVVADLMPILSHSIKRLLDLCLYCHDNEHQRQQALGADADEEVDAAKHTPFAGLGDALRRRDPP